MPRLDTAPKRLADGTWLQEPRLAALLTLLNADGAVTRVAGGAVRNALLGEPISDVDLATTLTPEAVMTRARKAGLGVHPTGLAHGTVTIVSDGTAFEVTTLRRDVATDGRRATVAFTSDWHEDAARRDFTMNSMYCDASGIILDPVDGYEDCVKRRVRFVGSPRQRIEEDYLRILRFFRFHARYGKGALDAKGLAACRGLKKGLSGLSAERIRQELLKLLVAPRAIETLKVMAASGVLAEVLPFKPQWLVLKRMPADAILRLFVLAKAPASLQEGLRLSNAEAKRLAALATAPAITPELRMPERHRLLYSLGTEAFLDALALSKARRLSRHPDQAWSAMANEARAWDIPRFPLNGNDLKSLGLAPGPVIGEMLRQLEDWWIASDFKPTRAALLQRAQTLRSSHA